MKNNQHEKIPSGPGMSIGLARNENLVWFVFYNNEQNHMLKLLDVSRSLIYAVKYIILNHKLSCY